MTDCGCIDILCPHRGLDPDGGLYDVRTVAPSDDETRAGLRQAMTGLDTEDVYSLIQRCRADGVSSENLNAVLTEAIVQEHVACRTRFPVTFDRQAADERMAGHVGRCPSLRWRPWRRWRQRRAWLARAADTSD